MLDVSIQQHTTETAPLTRLSEQCFYTWTLWFTETIPATCFYLMVIMQ